MTCMVLNVHKNIKKEVCLNLYFYSAAQPIMEFGPKNLTVLDGKDATLSCRAAGAPTPNTTWIINGKISFLKQKHFVVQYTITKILQLKANAFCVNAANLET